MKLLLIDYKMDPQKIQITEAQNTIPALEVVHQPDRFLLLLKQHNITDLSDKQKVKIQKDGDRYIFSIFDNKQETSFSVAGYNTENFISKFLDKQKSADEHIAVQLTGLQLEIIRGSNQMVIDKEGELKEHQKESTDPEVIGRRIDTLKEFFNNQINDARRESFWGLAKYSRSRQERDYRRLHKEEAKKRLKDLKNIEKAFNKTERGLASDVDFNQELTEGELKNLSKQLDSISYNVPQFVLQNQTLRNGNADITPNYEINLSKLNKNQAKKRHKVIENYNKKQSEVNAITGKGVAEQMRAKDLADFQKYLEDVANNKIDPTLYPYTPKNKEEYEYITELLKKLQNEYPDLSKDIIIKEATTNTQGGVEGGNQGGIDKLNDNKGSNGINNGKVLDANGNLVDATSEGGLFGAADKLTENWQDKSERGQNFYKSFGNVALLAGGIFLGIKAIGATWRIIRGKGEKGDRGRLGGTAGLLLLTAGRPQDLFKGGYASEKFADLLKMIGFGGGKENQSNTPTQQIEQSTTGAMTLFNGMKYEDMKKIIKPDSDGKMKLDPVYRKSQLDVAKAIEKTGSGIDKANAQAKIAFLEAIGQDDKRGLINLALISMNMNWEALQNSANANKEFNTGAQEYIQRTLELAKLMNDRNYQKTNSESDAKIQEYMQGKIPLDELEASGAFEKIVALPQNVRDNLRGQVDALDITDPVKKQNLLEAIYQFYQDWNASDKSTFKIEKDANGNIVISTYGEKTPIALDKRIPGLPITFETTKEALRVANLTNKIKSLSRNLTPVNNDREPFEFDALGRLSFNNTSWYEAWKQDLTLISKEGLQDTSRKFSDKTHKETYKNYLNGLGVRGGGQNQNVTEAFIPAAVAVGTVEAVDNNDTAGIKKQTTRPENLNEEEKTRLEELLKKFDTLTDISETEKEKIKSTFTKFYSSLGKNLSPELKISSTTKGISLNSYGGETNIDFINKKIIDKKTSRELPVALSYEELFNVANLTNNIISITQNKESNGDYSPFKRQSDIAPFGIKFNDTELLSLGFDTRIISGSALSSLSEALSRSGNSDYYIEHLNDLWLNKQVNGLPSLIANKANRKEAMEGFKLFIEAKQKDNPGKVEFKDNKMISRGYATAIDLKDFTIFGDIPVDKTEKTNEEAYRDLFELVDIINKAKDFTVRKGAGSNQPFNASWGAFDIEFDDKGGTMDDDIIAYEDLKRLNPRFKNMSDHNRLIDKLNDRWLNGHKTE